MSINVYWSVMSPQLLRAEEPQPVFSRFAANYGNKNNDGIKQMFYCPAVSDSLKNFYALKSVYDYSFFVDKNSDCVFSPDYSQDFYNNHVVARDIQSGFFSFSQKYIFFTEEKSLKITVNVPAFYENNFVSNNVIPIMGEYDIGKWYRPLDFAFFLKDGVSSFEIKKGDAFCYIKFHTDEKINFKKFQTSDELEQISKLCVGSSQFKKNKFKNIYNFYNMFGKNLKKRTLEEIYKNPI